MKVKFNHYERVAGIFVAVAIVGSVVSALGVAVKKGWFSSKVRYSTLLPSADGIHPGTLVQISGLRAGTVEEVVLLSASEVEVRFYVLETFSARVRKDSTIQVVRPFIIGEKVLEVAIGSPTEEVMPAEATIPTVASFDVMDVLSGKKLGPVLTTLERLTENLKILGEAFADPERTKVMVRMFDRMDPLLGNMNTMAQGVSRLTETALKNKRFEHTMENLAVLSAELGRVVPELARTAPDLGQQLGQIVNNLNVLTSEMQKLTPAIAAIAPDLPKTSLRAVEALDETVVLLKALQKSFLLRGNVKEVKDEEKRLPAGGSGP